LRRVAKTLKPSKKRKEQSFQNFGIMFVLFASPTAIVSFIMAEAMGSNSKLAGNIVLISTVASVFTIAAGIVILKELSLI